MGRQPTSSWVTFFNAWSEKVTRAVPSFPRLERVNVAQKQNIHNKFVLSLLGKDFRVMPTVHWRGIGPGQTLSIIHNEPLG
jgi:hypothetical protein